jgi:hypothetical protein
MFRIKPSLTTLTLTMLILFSVSQFWSTLVALLMFLVIGLFNPGHMQYEIDRANDVWGEPSLEEMVEKAIAILKRAPNGFLLFVESKSGDIDNCLITYCIILRWQNRPCPSRYQCIPSCPRCLPDAQSSGRNGGNNGSGGHADHCVS